MGEQTLRKDRVARPTAVATWPFGRAAAAEAGEVLRAEGTAMDAVEAGIRMVELDPDEHSVGYGGFPNAAGVVQLDAAVMDGRTHRAGSVAALEGCRTPISVARRVMEKSRHVMLVGEGARQFALAQGFPDETTLTPAARQRWEEWTTRKHSAASSHDTIGLVALDAMGNLAVGCSTSGLAFKDVGRVGDSPLLGSGLYVDNDVGGAAATGVGEEIMKFCLSFLAVETMRQGATPAEACEAAIRRMTGKRPTNRRVGAAVLALDRFGRHGGYSTAPGFSYGLWTVEGSSLVEVAVRH
jgi:isoaspartyl peptidase/L-asparaginase-like protein (Ntn-hydrolase superfamily)